MICTDCGHQNRAGKRFCTRCGAALLLGCHSCGSTVEPDERFCGDCGAAVASLPAATDSSPPAVPVSGERKQITVLFADVAGSMDLQEQLDAEVWAQIMGRFVRVLAEGVRKFGGTVDKFTGDGIMALFGAPLAQEDHARRACHAAWHLTKAIEAYSNDLRAAQGVELNVRLGLNSGEVVVGRVGDDVTLDPTALGHTVGLAQRMEAMAERGKAYLTGHTARLVEGWFRLEEVGLKIVKGASEALDVYVLDGPCRSQPVLRGGHGLGAAALVGREREMAVLEDALAMAAEGQFQVVGVVGEAGVGKSRLCDEFVASARSRGITVRWAAGVSHAQDVPLLPVLALLRDYFGITEADDDAPSREKIKRRVLALDPAGDEVLPLLFYFLEVPDPGRPAPQLAPDVRMRRIFEALRRLTQRRTQREILVLMVEDLHWFDPQSGTFLERLIESFPGSRTLVLANFRPEFSARWMRHSYYRQLPLAPLQDSAVGQLLGGLLGMDFSLAPLQDFVQERTGGNPFFVEEVIRAFVEDGTLAGNPGNYRLTRSLHEVKAPASVQAVLGARIDRLPAEHKTVLQTAAVIGRVFDPAVLAQVTGSVGEELDDVLSALCAAELLQEAAQDSTVAYRFWHALTQEVAYSSLLGEHRRRLHAAVAEALMAGNANRLDELAAVVAWHWECAGEDIKAAEWNVRAGAWAVRTDLAEAERRWRTAVELLAKAPESLESAELAVRARRGLIQWGARRGADPAEVERLLADGQRLAERSADIGLQSMLTYVGGSWRALIGDVQGARTQWVHAARLAERTGRRPLISALAAGPILALSLTGPLDEALSWSERALSVAGDDADLGAPLIGYSPLVRALSFRAEVLLYAGRLRLAQEDAETTIAMARRRSEPEHLAWGLTIGPRLAWMTGETIDTIGPAEEAIRIGEDTGNPLALVIGLRAVAVAHLIQGDAPAAAAAAERALTEGRSRHTGLFFEADILAWLARACLAAGDDSRALAAAAEALAVAQRQGARVAECLALMTRAQLWRATDKPAAVVASDLEAGLTVAKETRALAYEPFIHEELGRLHDDRRELWEALRLYRQIGATGHARRLEGELSARTLR